MGLFNHLFGSREDIARELVMDDNKRMALWTQHVENISPIEALCKHFSFGNISAAVANLDATLGVIAQIKSLISKELITIEEDEKDEAEILADIGKLKNTVAIHSLSETLLHETRDIATMKSHFNDIHNAWILALHLITLIEKRHSNVKDLLLKLFSLLFHTIPMLYKPFKEEFYTDRSKHLHSDVIKLARAVILQKELEEEVQTAEERFGLEMAKHMSTEKSFRKHRRFGEAIFDSLLKMAAVPESEDEDIQYLERLDAFIHNDRILDGVIKTVRSKINDTDLKIARFAIRRAYVLGHFEDLEADYKSYQ